MTHPVEQSDSKNARAQDFPELLSALSEAYLKHLNHRHSITPVVAMQDNELSDNLDRLKAILETATEVVLSELANKANQVAVNEEITAVEINYEARTWKMKETQRLSPLISSGFAEEITKMAEFPQVKKCIEFMSSAGFAERFGWSELPLPVEFPEETKRNMSKETFLLHRIFRNFVADYIMNFKFEFNQGNFSKVFEELKSHVGNSDGNRKSAVVLRNFDMVGIDSIEIFGCRLRYIETEELLGLIRIGAYDRNVGNPYALPPSGLSGILNLAFCISLPPLIFAYKESEKRSEKRHEEIKLKIQLLLQLFKPELVGANTEINYNLNYPRAIGASFAASVDFFELAINQSQKYTLHDCDVSNLKKLEEKINKIDFDRWEALKLATMRFVNIHFKRNEYDTLIDLMIVLETLLGPRDRSEIGFRISLRLAHLIGGDKKHREEIFNMAYQSYELRSRIVHGGSDVNRYLRTHLSEYGINNLKELIPRLNEYVRLLLLALIGRASDSSLNGGNFEDWHKDLLKDIDRNIVAG